MVLKEVFNKHKIFAHKQELSSYVTGGNPPPISVEIHPSSHCPHNCIDCVDHSKQNSIKQNTLSNLSALVKSVASMGVKAVVFSGGEPLAHKDFLESVLEGSQLMDIGIITNGQMLTPELSNILKPQLSKDSWIRISLNADGPEMHEKYHRVSGKYEVIIKNIKALVKERGDITIGIAFNTSPWTINGMVRATETAKSLGVNYIQFRPFIALSPHDETICEVTLQRKLEECKEYRDEDFDVITSTDKYEQVNHATVGYARCHAQQFASTLIAANGKVYVCCYGSYREEFCLGDTNSDDLEEIWKSERRQQIICELEPKKNCPRFCRFQGLNREIEEFLQQSSSLSQDEMRKAQFLPHKNFL